MRYKCAFSGSGGQGAALMAKLVCLAGIKEAKQVVMTQTYGIEQRGGDSTGYVILSDEAIGNPIVESDADIAVAMSESIYQTALESLKTGGMLFVNSSLIEQPPTRSDITQISLPVSDIAKDMGNVRVANIVMLGAVIGATKMLNLDSIAAALQDSMGKKNAALLDLNIAALKGGMSAVVKEKDK